MSNIELASNFKDVLREKVLETFMGLIPQDKIQEYINKEIYTFFEQEQLLTITESKIEVENPNYDPRSSSYGNEKKLTRDCITFGSKMTPFRQLVWNEIYTYIKPKVSELLQSENSSLKKELDTWFITKATVDLKESNTTMFNNLAVAMAGSMMSNTIRTALDYSNMNIKNALDQFKDIKVFVNNNPDKNSFDYLYNGEGLDYCLVLDVPRKTLSLVEPGREQILANNIKLNTIKKEEVETQKVSIIFTDGTDKVFTTTSEQFGFKELMKWYYSKESNVFEFTHSTGFTTIRRDLVKHIEFNKI
jgi:hypothetical protein